MPQLVVCGGGHVAAAVVQLAKLLGLTVLAMDDREEYAQQLRLAGADKVLCLPFDKALAQVPDGAETYFVVVTRAHAFDVDCLKVILRKPAAYVGMMGSRGRAALVRRQLWKPVSMPKEWRRCTPHRAFHQLTDGRGDRTFHSGTDRIDQECASADGGLFICPSGSHGSDRCRRAAGGACCDCGAARLYAAGNRRKMLVRTDGSIVGSVGGGIMEHRTILAAQEMLTGAAPAYQRLHFRQTAK